MAQNEAFLTHSHMVPPWRSILGFELASAIPGARCQAAVFLLPEQNRALCPLAGGNLHFSRGNLTHPG